jgi:S1-C subfamily serine protease
LKETEMKKLRLAFVALLITAALLAGCSAAGPVTTQPLETAQLTSTPAGNVTSLFNESAMAALYDRCIPAVVLIITATSDNQGGQGSGFIIDGQGTIATNYHVIDNANKIVVDLHDGQTLDAEIIGTDRESDLALIKVDASKLGRITPLVLGDSDQVRAGQIAIALGSPYQLEGSITAGIISGLGRPLTASSERTIPDMLQTDAAINPGNSGGPLLNSAGQVIGINTAIETQSSGIGFAIPINTLKTLLPELRKGGEVGTPWIGIESLAISQSLVTKLKLDVSKGIYVISVTKGSPAEQAGIKGSGSTPEGIPATGGDIITAVDGKNISSVEDVIIYLNGKRPGDKISLTVLRGSETLTVKVTLGEWPDALP